ncbi:MAG: hypothetical protein ACI8XO_005108 [Verrucomicrobiales bacterium]|jgi:hypothetical protein
MSVSKIIGTGSFAASEPHPAIKLLPPMTTAARPFSPSPIPSTAPSSAPRKKQILSNHRIIEVLPNGQQNRSYGCMGGLTRLPVAGRDIVIFSNIETPNSRLENGTVWASFNGGKTWPIKRLATPGSSGYSSMNAGRPGTASEGWIYLMAETHGAVVVRFNLSWLIEGGEATGDGKVPDWAKQ